MLTVIAIDSNIFIYLLEANPSFGQKAYDLFVNLEKQKIPVVASELVFAEVLASKQITDAQAKLLTNKLSNLDVNFMPVDKQVLLKAASLRRKYNLGFADSIHVSSAIIAGAEEFITNDHALLKKTPTGIKLVKI